MKRILLTLIAVTLVATPALADWQVGQPYKMHEPQLPDPNGWDVMATGNVSLPNALTLADDWECTESGYVEDIHFWGSWRQDIEGEIVMFHIAIHDDIEVGPHGFSVPGEERWFREIYAPEVIVSPPIPGDQGWYDPASGIYEPNDHQWFYQYNIFLEGPDLFYQEAGTVYWLRITAFVNDPVSTLWGWKSSYIHYRDDAVWSYYEMYPFEWWEMYEPNGGGGPVVNNFWVAFDPDGMIIPDMSGGVDYYDGPGGINGWFYYPSSEWWNIWFYNAPFDPERYKEISIMGWVQKLEPGLPAWIEIAIDWSGPNWPPGQPPPINPEDDPFIERFPFFISDLEMGGEPFEFWQFMIEQYNPEWVSVDVRGYNFMILETEPGIIEHECLPSGGPGQSLDLAFVITGGPETDIPTLNEWGMIILGLLLLTAGTIAVVRRRKAAVARTN